MKFTTWVNLVTSVHPDKGYFKCRSVNESAGIEHKNYIGRASKYPLQQLTPGEWCLFIYGDIDGSQELLASMSLARHQLLVNGDLEALHALDRAGLVKAFNSWVDEKDAWAKVAPAPAPAVTSYGQTGGITTAQINTVPAADVEAYFSDESKPF